MHPIEDAFAVLPWWIGWAGLMVYAPAVALLSFLIARWSMAVMLRPLRKCPDEPWAERARLAFPARTTAIFNVLTLSGGAVALGSLFHGPLARLPAPLFIVLVTTAAFVPALAVSVAQEHCLGQRRVGFAKWLRGCLAFWLVVHPNLLVIAITAALLPSKLNGTAVLGLVVSAALVWLCGRDYNIAIARALGVVRPASARVLGIVARAAERAGLRPRAVYEIVWGRVNAFAVPNLRMVAFTEGALQCMNDDQIAAICTHELAHLAESPQTLRLRSLSAYALFPIAAFSPVHGTFGAPGVAVLGVMALLGSRWYARISQAKERDADRAAHGADEDAQVYASALEALHRSSLIPAVLGDRSSTHPDLYDRLLAAGVQPDFPRPAKPPRLRAMLVTALVPLLFGVTLGAVRLAPVFAARPRRASETALLWSLGLGGGASELTRLAYRREQRGERLQAITLLRAACELNREDAYFPAVLAVQLAKANRLPDAEAALKDAEARAEQAGVDDRDEEWLDRADRAVELCREQSVAREEADE